MTQSEKPAGGAEALAQQELETMAEEMERFKTRLRAVHQSLAAPAVAEATLDADDATDLATEIRALIDCIFIDRLEPMIRDLQAAAALRGR
jgi:hypothetical protein